MREANYEAFGGVLSTGGSMMFVASYTGKELDEATGLYYFNARWYDSSLGKFITEDPARDGTNWYEYCRNNPLRYTDPTGMWTDNGDGTFTAVEGDTLWDLYGADWQEKSGYEGDPTKLQIGDVVGKKNEISESLPVDNTIDSQEITTPEKEPNFLLQGLLGGGEILGGLATYVGITAWGIAQEAAAIKMQGTLDPSVGYSMLAGYTYASIMLADGINLLSNAFAKKKHKVLLYQFLNR
ncbi:RHS repeat-associated core domain-containing protein [Brucepastera parasyntrophica]|uniref:RHS repeat-associated core domain-containing protein n=1 Tax=Brucepastera parasyntrophica TaxID=2880008 RepID=UPI003F709CCB